MNKQKLYIFALLVMAAVSPVASAEDDYIHTDRYTLAKVEARNDQKSPLTTVITLSFGTDIKTVGQALQELLQGSGYRWESQNGEHNDQLLSELPLPAIVRTLGPIRLNDALDVVAGEAWGLVVNETNRTVWFETVQIKNTQQQSK